MEDGKIIWLTGQTGSGKTTLAKKFYELFGMGTIVLDEDVLVREDIIWEPSMDGGWIRNLRTAHLAKLLAEQGYYIIVASKAPFVKLRKIIKEITHCTFFYLTHNDYPNDPNRPYEAAVEAEIIVNRKED